MICKVVKLFILLVFVFGGNIFAKNSYPKKPSQVNFAKSKICKRLKGFTLVKSDDADFFLSVKSKKSLALGFSAKF